jgi:GAF domain-containing protein
MVGHVAATGRMRYAPDVQVDPHYIPCEPDTRSEVDIPLITNGKVIGVVSVTHAEADAFSGDQLQVLIALAEHIGVAIENARLFQQERQERYRMVQEAEEARAIQRALFGKAFLWSLVSHSKLRGAQQGCWRAIGSTSSTSGINGLGLFSRTYLERACPLHC